MKQRDIFHYLPRVNSDKEEKIISNPNNLNKKKHVNKIALDKNTENPVQIDLIETVKEHQKFKALIKKLGRKWHKNEEGFGYIDKNRIMLFGSTKDFDNNFFKVYNKKDFRKVKKDIDLNEKKEGFISINSTKYKDFYLRKAFEVLGKKCQLYQHKKLKLLILRNSDFATLICPNFG